jgi:hypothetical protein
VVDGPPRRAVHVEGPVTEVNALFESSRPFLFFEYFRVPYRTVSDRRRPWPEGEGRHPLRACAELRWRGDGGRGRALRWPPFEDGRSPLETLAPMGSYQLGPARLYGHVLPDALCGPWLASSGTRWTASTPVRDRRGNHVASEWRGDDGSVFLPYDPSEIIHNFWSEAYRTAGGGGLHAAARQLALGAYYRARPAIPRAGQIWMRRQLSRVQARARFPRWPVESSLHDLYARLFRQVTEVAGEPVPWLSPWPHGRRWALVLTHDVETSVGYRRMHLLRDVELRHGLRSCWNFVPRRYPVDDAAVEALQRDGFEVGVHGLYHDGRDLESLATLGERLPAIRQYADRWGAVGYRSPATHRRWGWMPLLGFEYDSSYPDTDPFEPQSGGCCTWLPYFNDGLVELPMTVPQDHTVFVILAQRDGRLWREKAEHVRRHGGMVLLTTHPDYLLEERLIGEYRDLLERFAADATGWRALPRDVCQWWRRRAASQLEPTASGWRIVGPASGEATVTYQIPE